MQYVSLRCAANHGERRDRGATTTDPDDAVPRNQWRDRSHADDQGAAIELLTGMLTGDNEAVRRAVRTVQHSSAEAAGLVIGLAKIGVGLLRVIGNNADSDALRLRAG